VRLRLSGANPRSPMKPLTVGVVTLCLIVSTQLGAVSVVEASTTNADTGFFHCIHPAQKIDDANWDPNSQCETPFARIASGTPITMICWQDGRVPAGSTSARWFYATGKDTSGATREGFIYEPRVSNQTVVGHCSMRRDLATTMWATAHLGQVITQDAAERNAYTDWAPGPVGEWSGDCAKFAQLAWWKSTHSGSGATMYSSYKNAGVMNPMSSTPPRGALVFWDGATAGGYGHVAVSIGNGFMVTTQGLDNSNKPIVIQNITSISGADGWVAASAVVVKNHNPVGAYDSVAALGSGRVRVRGWSWDASNSGVQLGTHIYVGGQAGQAGALGYDVGAANASRFDVDRVYHSGAYHGIDKTFTTSKRGSQQVCVYAINWGPGTNVLLGCKTVSIS
jgi:cell wall-associated NlpC family hydrolase